MFVSLKLYIILIDIVLKGFWYPVALFSDWYPMLLFESSLSSAFWNVLSYSVIRAYSVSGFEKRTTIFRYISLLCYLELWSEYTWISYDVSYLPTHSMLLILIYRGLYHRRTWSTLVHAMACCLKTPSHYLNQCSLISEVPRPSPRGQFRKWYVSHQSLKLIWKLLI